VILTKDHKYQYCKQLSLWVEHLKDLMHMVEPFGKDYPHCIIRRNSRGKYALFVRGDARPQTRYKLEVVLRCEVYDPKLGD
jgi:hypothetical protein